MTRYSVCVLIAAAFCIHPIHAQNQYLPLAPLPTTSTNQTIWTPGQTFPSFNAPSPTFQSFNTTTTGMYNPVPSSGTVVQQIYPTTTATPLVSPTVLPGALPPPTGATPPGAFQGVPPGGLPLQIREVPLQMVQPPDIIAPGLATIQNGKWSISDFFYNLTEYIGVKIEILKPHNNDLYLNGALIERQVKEILEGVNIITEPNIVPCGPPLPIYHILIMAYPCRNCCVGFVTAQLFERGRPQRLQLEVNGIWQIVTWQRQSMIASNCEDFAFQVSQTVKELTSEFAQRYAFYHPRPEIPCFNVSENSRLPPPNYNPCP